MVYQQLQTLLFQRNVKGSVEQAGRPRGRISQKSPTNTQVKGLTSEKLTFMAGTHRVGGEVANNPRLRALDRFTRHGVEKKERLRAVMGAFYRLKTPIWPHEDTRRAIFKPIHANSGRIRPKESSPAHAIIDFLPPHPTQTICASSQAAIAQARRQPPRQNLANRRGQNAPTAVVKIGQLPWRRC